jgi:hypothetical protein
LDAELRGQVASMQGATRRSKCKLSILGSTISVVKWNSSANP